MIPPAIYKQNMSVNEEDMLANPISVLNSFNRKRFRIRKPAFPFLLPIPTNTYKGTKLRRTLSLPYNHRNSPKSSKNGENPEFAFRAIRVIPAMKPVLFPHSSTESPRLIPANPLTHQIPITYFTVTDNDINAKIIEGDEIKTLEIETEPSFEAKMSESRALCGCNVLFKAKI